MVVFDHTHPDFYSEFRGLNLVMQRPVIPHPNREELKLIRDSLFSAESIVFLRVGRAVVGVFTSEIIWIESVENYAKFHTYDKYILSPFTIKDLINKLPEKFVRISRSAIVNIQWISWFDKDQVILLNGVAVGFGEGGKKGLIERINLL